MKNRLEYILRTPKERRKLKKMLLSYQKNLKKEWPRLSDPSSGYTKANRKLITSLAEFSTKCLETIDRLDQNAGVTDKN
ncbi:MAG: hypothetical protein A3F04_01280 [Candidatus Chisholmbacteria bacterium RIFCSPHIGHO2_12_FULL_49_9]|nr:MAG: hypothetical protein A3F04_01280 [Candidatus Chisholmbacteria bacterium RIFCSPHIGHO2_12_FULL_49_9]